MAFEKNIYELKILFVVLIGLPLIASTNIDCGGRPFHCLNSTHFMICVDLGGGVSYTIDDFVIQCPPPTVCLKTNRYECELATTTTSTTLKPTTALQYSVTEEKETTTEEIIVDTLPWSAGPEQHIELSTTVDTVETTTDASVISLSTDTTGYEIVLNTKGLESATYITTEPSEVTTVSDQAILNISNKSADASPTDIILTNTYTTSDNLTTSENSDSVAIVLDDIKANDNITISNKTNDENVTTTQSESTITEYLIYIEENNTTEITTVNNSDINTNFTEKEHIFVPTPVSVTNSSTIIVQQTKGSSLSERSVSTTDSSFVLQNTSNTFNNYDSTTDSSATVAVNVNSSKDEIYIIIPEDATTFVSSAVSTTEFTTVLNPSKGLVQDTLNYITNTPYVNVESITSPKEVSTNSAIIPETNNGTGNLINTIESENFNTTQITENIILTTESSILTTVNNSQSGYSEAGVTTENIVLSDNVNQYLEENIPANTTTVSTGTNYKEEQNTAVDIVTTPPTVSIDLNKSIGSEIQKVAEQALINTTTIINIETDSENREITTESINYLSTKLNTTEIEEITNDTLIVTADLDSPTTLTIIMEQLSNYTNNQSIDTPSTLSSKDVNSSAIDVNSTTESLSTTIDTTTVTTQATILLFEFNASTVSVLQYNSTTEKQGPVTTTPLTLRDIFKNSTSSHVINSTTKVLDTSVIFEINTEETILLSGTKFAKSLNKSEPSVFVNYNDTSDAVVQLSNASNTAQIDDTVLTESQTNSLPNQFGFTQANTEISANDLDDLPPITEQSITSWTVSQDGTEQINSGISDLDVKNTKQITVNELTENTTLAAPQANTELNTTPSIELFIVTPVEFPANTVIPESDQKVTGPTDSQHYSAPAETAGYFQQSTSQSTALPASSVDGTAESHTNTEWSTTEMNLPQANTKRSIAELSESSTHIQKSKNGLTKFAKPLNKSEPSVFVNYNDTSDAVVQLSNASNTAQTDDTVLTQSQTNSLPNLFGFTQANTEMSANELVDLPPITEQSIISWTVSQDGTEQTNSGISDLDVKNTKQITVNELTENTTLGAPQPNTELNTTPSTESYIVTSVESPANTVIPESDQNVTGPTDSQIYSAPAETAGYSQQSTSQSTALPANTVDGASESQTNTEGSTTEMNLPQANTKRSIAELSESSTHMQKSSYGLTESQGNEGNTEQSLVGIVGSEANVKQTTITVTESQVASEQITAAQTNTITTAVPATLSPKTSVQLLESQNNTEKITILPTESSTNSEQGKSGIIRSQGNLDQITLAVTESQGTTYQITATQTNTDQSPTELSGSQTNTEQGIEQINGAQANTEQNYAFPIGPQSNIEDIIATQANTQTSEVGISAPKTKSEIGITRPTASQLATEQSISGLNVSQSAQQKSNIEKTESQPIIFQHIGAGQTTPEAVSGQGITNTTGSIATSQQSTSNLLSSQVAVQQSALDLTGSQVPSQQDIDGITSPDATSQQSTSGISGLQVTTRNGSAEPIDSQTTSQQGASDLAGSQTTSQKGITRSTYSESTSDSGSSQVSSQQGSSDLNGTQATPQLGSIAEKADSQCSHNLTGSQATLQEGNKETTGSQTQGTWEPIDSQATSQQSIAVTTDSLTTSKQSTSDLIGLQATSHQDNVVTTGLQATTESIDSQVTLQQSTYDLNGQVITQQGITLQTIPEALSEKDIGASTDTQATSLQNIAQQTRLSQQNNNGPQTTVQQSNNVQDITGKTGSRVVNFVQSVALLQANKTQNVSQPSELTIVSDSQNITAPIEHSENGLVGSQATNKQITNISSGSQDYSVGNTVTVNIDPNNIIANITQFTKQIGPQEKSIGQSGIIDSDYNKPTQHLQNDVKEEIKPINADNNTIVNTFQSERNRPLTNVSSGIQDSLNLTSALNRTQLTFIYNSQNTSDGSNKTKLRSTNPDYIKINLIKYISKDNDSNINFNSKSEITPVFTLTSQHNVTSDSNYNISEYKENGILASDVAPTPSANANTETVTEALLNDNTEYNIVTTTTSTNIMKLSDKNQQNSQVTQENKRKVSAVTLPIANTRTPDITTMSYFADTLTTNMPLVSEMSTTTTATESTNKVETTATTATEGSDAESSSPYPANDNTLSEQQFDCQGRLGGRYADNDDCSKFYICSGTVQTIVGSCPVNTVFSDIKKLCTRNLSHCIRNNEFKCTSSGRFADHLKPNVYYICMKKDQSFLRYKLQCQEGYLLNRLTVTCYKNNQPSSQSASIDNSQSTSDKVSQEKEVQKSRKDKKVKEVFECEDEGKFPDPYNCRGYYICKLKNRSDETYRRKYKKCDQDEVFHREKKKCVDASSSHECRYCDSLVLNIYYVRIKRGPNFITYKLQCQNDYQLNMKTVMCKRQIESSSQSESHNISKSTSEDVSQKKNSDRNENRSSFECEEEGKFADPNDCRRYYLCKEKRKSRTRERRFKSKQKKCGRYQVFSEEKQRCIYSSNNRCM